MTINTYSTYVATISLGLALILASPASAQNRLVATGTFPRELLDIGLTTGDPSLIAEVDEFIAGLAYDRNTSTLYGIESFLGSRLFTIDPNTGARTVVGNTGINGFRGLAYDPNAKVLYASFFSGRDLYTVDTTTAAATFVGDIGFSNVNGLAFDPNTNTLYGTAFEELITIDTTTGAGTSVGSTGIAGAGAAFDADTNTLYATGANTPRVLYTINTSTGEATQIGANDISNQLGGLAVVVIPEPASAALLGLAGVALMCGRNRRYN